MAKFSKSKRTVRKAPKQNNIPSKAAGATGLQKVRSSIYRQAALTLLTVVLTVVILFAMTSAWYTNVAQTSGLNFKTEAWGFKGTITVDNESILAAPGDEGIINLTVENDSDTVSAISVNISKNAMVKEMQQRLYFYVDTRVSRNGEIVDRVYLNKYEGYTYNVFSNSNLTLTEQFSNAPVIKWEWVYDVLGYYVLAQPYEIETSKTVTVENDDGTTSEVTTTEITTVMSIKEYLRPIVYDFDEATTLIDTEGEKIKVELNTINGATTPEEFLYRLSLNDGYKGYIDPSVDHVFDNYYKVEVEDENSGYGIYAYLCNYAEIQMATKYDTELGELAYNYANGHTLTTEQFKKLHHDVTLTLSAQKDNNTVVTVNTLGSLQQAIDMGVSNVVQLTSDITIGEGQTICIPENVRVMLDLNGHTITNQDGVAIDAAPGSSLTVTNGTITQGDQSSIENPGTTYAVRSIGAEVVLSEVAILGEGKEEKFQYGVYVSDNSTGNDLDSRVYLVDCNIYGEICAVFISGNGLVSEQKSRLIVENSKLKSPNIVISGNGTTTGNGRWGTDIQIIDSYITGVQEAGFSGYSVGIYQPQKNSTLTVIRSQVIACTGIGLKGGSAEIEDSLVVGTGVYHEPEFLGSGFTDTGDAIYVESGYEYDIYLKISGHSILQHVDENSLSVRVFEENAPNVVVEIEGGTFDEALLPEYLMKGAVQNVDDKGKTIVVLQEELEDTTEEQTDETTEPE